LFALCSVSISNLKYIEIIQYYNLTFAAYTGSLTSKYRGKTALRTDHRVRLMNEVINGIQAIKMYAWEKPYGILISKARK